jgi:hypothetical protein
MDGAAHRTVDIMRKMHCLPHCHGRLTFTSFSMLWLPSYDLLETWSLSNLSNSGHYLIQRNFILIYPCFACPLGYVFVCFISSAIIKLQWNVTQDHWRSPLESWNSTVTRQMAGGQICKIWPGESGGYIIWPPPIQCTPFMRIFLDEFRKYRG